jgi:hypothetical protein
MFNAVSRSNFTGRDGQITGLNHARILYALRKITKNNEKEWGKGL